MERGARKLASHEARRTEHERQRVSADNTVRGSLNVGVIESEGTELANVFSREKMLKTQTRKGAST